MATWKKILTEEDGNIGSADQSTPTPGSGATVTRNLTLTTPDFGSADTQANFAIRHTDSENSQTVNRFLLRNFSNGNSLDTIVSLIGLDTSEIRLQNTIDTAGTTNILKFYEAGGSPTNFTSLQAASSISSNVTLILPKVAPQSGELLYHTTSNQLAFASSASLSTNIGNTNLSLSANRELDMAGNDFNIKDGVTSKLFYDDSEDHWVFGADVRFDKSDGGEIKLREPSQNGDKGVILKAPNTNLGSDLTFTLPSADGSDGHVLKTNGAGALSFVAQSGGLDSPIDTYAENRVLTAGNSNTNIDAEQYLTYNDHSVSQSGSNNTPSFPLLQNTGVIHCKSNGKKPSGFLLDATNAVGDSGLDVEGTLVEGASNGTHIALHFATVDLTTRMLYTFYDSSGPALQLARANAAATAIGFIGYYADDTYASEASAILLTEGIVNVPAQQVNGTFTEGGILYLDNTEAGKFTFTVPNTANHYVRHLGYALYSDNSHYVVYFKPSTDFIQLN
jgi:hypothetical protein|tara:strand:+ start:39 stop:1556 length:1518 start_codon:yes stop_codon:yes gene_type:complete